MYKRQEYSGATYQFDKDNYALTEHGVREPVDDALIELFGDMVRQEQIAAMRAVQRVLNRLEKDASTVVRGWGNTSAVATPWDQYAAATPLDDIETASNVVEDRIGMIPNKIGMSWRLWRHLIRCAQFENKLDMGTNNAPNQVTMQGFKSLFPQFEEIVFWGAYENTANQSQDASLQKIWRNSDVFIGHIHNDGLDGDLTAPIPNVGRTLFYRDGNSPLPGAMDAEASIIMEEYRVEKRRGGDIRARNWRAIKKLHEEAGQLLTGAAT